MKKVGTYLAILFLIGLCLSSCKKQKATEETSADTLIINEQLAIEFAQKIEQSVLNEVPDFFNEAFDKQHIKEVISAQNSIVSSSFDMDFGREAFDNNFKYGDFAVNAVQDGGDFRFLKHYVKDGIHHVIFRIYDDFGLKIDDFTLGVNSKNEIRIKDAYIYNMSSTFSNVVMHDLLYCTMMNTEPDAAAQAITKAEKLLNEKKYAQLLSYLKEKKSLIKDFPYYNFFYINALNETSTHFVSDLEALRKDSLDERCILVHKLIYYMNVAKPAEVENTIQQLMDFTGEDPIYWVFYGKSLANAKKYNDALKAYSNAEQGMPTIWDIWEGKLQCYYQLHDDENFKSCLAEANEKFGMSESEVRDYVRAWYPRYVK